VVPGVGLGDPGHSYTLSLTNHDDNSTSDPTSVFDDITLS
jgi:hypothetical protein